ncbi:hypothetical protein [Lapidilactobacillus bayanensis]|uniref:hypothetical protein n=1 Tax=Lapidilactobacillus bayanensis TaxID=2485998 RepID=UPI000F7B74AB|nr:hypothetical protein [Lapidilactobacillus bayanensis]
MKLKQKSKYQVIMYGGLIVDLALLVAVVILIQRAAWIQAIGALVVSISGLINFMFLRKALKLFDN